MKKPRPYNTDEEPQTMASEPMLQYGCATNAGNRVLSTLCNNSKKTTECTSANYEQWKAEADELYGKNKRMTPEEYFDKLWYVVERAYEHV